MKQPIFLFGKRVRVKKDDLFFIGVIYGAVYSFTIGDYVYTVLSDRTETKYEIEEYYIYDLEIPEPPEKNRKE